MSSPYLQPPKTLPPMPTEWDHVPTLGELDRWIEFVPGITYAWSLASNLQTAKKDGYSQIRGLDPFTIAGQCVMLLGKGTPIQGARLQAALPELRIDNELDALLNPPPKKKVEPLKVNS